LFSPLVRKAALTVHVAASVGWLGGLLGFLSLAVGGLTRDEPATVRGAYIAMDLIGRQALVPLSLLAFVSGLVQSVGTVWGLLRHYWVVLKLGLTLVATVVLLAYTETMGFFATAAADPDRSLVQVRQGSPVVHAAGGLVLLLAALVLSIFKPKGLTHFGWRRQRQATTGSSSRQTLAGRSRAKLSKNANNNSRNTGLPME
jgi:uncharacterized membrane protein